MVTDDERREVAERLRGMHDYETAVPIIRACLGLKRGELMDDETRRRMSDRLADLIDPESGQNRDTVPKESPAVQEAPECDREELLRVADNLEYVNMTLRVLTVLIRRSLGVSDDGE